MKIAVITDSSSNLSFEYVKTINYLDMMPLMISYDDKFYRDQLEINYDLFSVGSDDLIDLMPKEFERFLAVS